MTTSHQFCREIFPLRHVMVSKASLLIMLATVLTGQCTADTDQKAESATSCVARAEMGQTASITCDFGRDVAATKHSIDVQFYPGDSNEPLSVLTCNWLVKRPNKPTCTASNECRYDDNFGQTLHIELSNATKSKEGRYICQLVPSDGIPARPCRLNVTDKPSPTEGVVAVADGNSTVSPNPGKPGENKTQVNVPAIILGITTSILCVCVVVLAVKVWRLRHERRNGDVQDAKQRSSSEAPFLDKS